MNTAASCDRMRIPVAPSSTGWLGDACAKFWLSVMFYLSRQAPGVIRTIEPFGSWGTWKCSQQFRRARPRSMPGAFSDPTSAALIASAMAEASSIVFYEFVFDLGRTSIMSRATSCGRRSPALKALMDTSKREWPAAAPSSPLLTWAHLSWA